MAGGSGGGAKPSSLYINLTPMIDCTMLLVIFFLLTTQMASPDYIKMNLPKPHNSVAQETEQNRAVVNVVPFSDEQIRRGEGRADRAMEYRVGTHHFTEGDLMKLVAVLKEQRQASSNPKEFRVEIRSDMRIAFAQVELVFMALQQAQIQKVHVSALREIGS
jgi:biopolymer transport protein ExbD